MAEDFFPKSNELSFDGGKPENNSAVASAGNTENTNNAESCWSIGVKPVRSGSAEDDFIVYVSPDDDLEKLHSQIETKTGLSAARQRLIYRGRLIGNNNHNNNNTAPDEGISKTETPSRKIKDITGLTDGHTIHLVERKVDASTNNATTGSPTDEQPNSNSSSTTLEEDITGANGTASLLAALLGMGDDAESSDNNNNNNSNNNNNTTTATAAASSARSWRPRYTSRRRMSYRLTEDDLEVPDPGSMESVRQGLMTLHTLLPAATTEQLHRSPLDIQRRFYQGQWIDVRDTVNQWLEATIVEILYPEDLLPPPNHDNHTKNSPTTLPATDPFVHGNDYEGRRRLLLEPCSEEEHEPALGVEVDEATGQPMFFRQRSSNSGVQLLLVHYNGWPHRWDEWIRSDSERIRPFRTRTRHPNTGPRISPTVQSPFVDHPSTHFLAGNSERRREQDDRHALLPELSRVVTIVNNLLAEAASASVPPLTVPAQSNAHLPWNTTFARNSSESNTIPEEDSDDNDVYTDAAESMERQPPTQTVCGRRRRQELEALAPLLDRLGRTLVDAAPHVASLAASLDQPGLETPPDDEPQQHPSTLGGFLSLLNRDRNRTSNSSSNAAVHEGTTNSHDHTHDEEDEEEEEEEEDDDTTSYEIQIDPDYTDYATALVNTTRGDVRGGPRSSRQSTSSSDELAGLLGAYLAATSLGGLVSTSNSNGDEEGGDAAGGLGRLLRERGAGNGIDIHIHAVVTAPGGNVGLATLGGGGGGGGLGTLLSSSSRSSNNRRVQTTIVPPQSEPQDDDGIFSALYSENPDPIDPSSPTATTVSVPTTPATLVTTVESSSDDGNNAISEEEDGNDEPPPPFSRNSRRSGFIATYSPNNSARINDNSISAPSLNTSSSNNNSGSFTTVSASEQSSTSRSPSRQTSSRSSSRSSRSGGVLSRFFRRSSDSHNH